MIELQITGKCRGCPFLQIDVIGLVAVTPDTLDNVKCSRQEFCDQLEDHLRRAIVRKKSEAET